MNWFPAIGLALAIGAPLPKEKVEAPNIVAEWVATGSIQDDEFIPLAEPKILVLEIQAGGQFRTLLNGEESDVGTYKVGSAKRPAEIDLSFKSESKPYLAIFKIEKDTLTLSHEYEPGAKRPTNFKSADRRIVTTFQRVKKE